jgi:hypothetical protein
MHRPGVLGVRSNSTEHNQPARHSNQELLHRLSANVIVADIDSLCVVACGGVFFKHLSTRPLPILNCNWGACKCLASRCLGTQQQR